MGKKRILFIGHEATRTGAPIMLLHLLRWLRENTDLDFDLLLKRGGPLAGDYARLCRVFQVPPGRFPSLPFKVLLPLLSTRNLGLIYSNTVTNTRLLRWLTPLRLPLVCHAHEVESYFAVMDKRELARLRDSTDLHIAGTEPMRGSLTRGGISPDKIHLVPGFLPVPPAAEPDLEERRRFRREHGLPEDAILVGGCGTLHWQKGPDLLLQVALRLARGPDGDRFHFAWAGTGDDSYTAQLAWDIRRTGLGTRFTLIPSLANPGDYLASLDIFAMTSRNDPSPLVALEAGARGLPVVCFEGNAIMVTEACGVIVPYLEVEAFAEAVRALGDDAARRARLGEAFAARVRERHDVAVAGPAILELIRPYLEPPR